MTVLSPPGRRGVQALGRLALREHLGQPRQNLRAWRRCARPRRTTKEMMQPCPLYLHVISLVGQCQLAPPNTSEPQVAAP